MFTCSYQNIGKNKCKSYQLEKGVVNYSQSRAINYKKEVEIMENTIELLQKIGNKILNQANIHDLVALNFEA